MTRAVSVIPHWNGGSRSLMTKPGFGIPHSAFRIPHSHEVDR